MRTDSKFGAEKLSEKEERMSLMTEVCKEFSEFNRLRLIKEGFERIYAAEIREDAENRYVEWQKLIPSEAKDTDGLYAAIHTLRRSMERWKKYIFSYFDVGGGYTNATTEGLNRLIDVIDSDGRGYKFETLRIKLLLYEPAADELCHKRKMRAPLDFSKRKRNQPAIMQSLRVSLEREDFEYEVEFDTVLVSGGGVVIEKLLDGIKLVL